MESIEDNSCDCESESSTAVWNVSDDDGGNGGGGGGGGNGAGNISTDSLGNGGMKCPLTDTFSTTPSVLTNRNKKVIF